MMPVASDRGRRTSRKEQIAEIVQGLHRLFKTVDTFSRRMLVDFGVTGPQIWALRTIAGEGSLTIGELADRMYLHMSTVSGIIDRLEERDLVTRERTDEDRRVVRLRVTRQGQAILQRAPEPPRSLIAPGLQRMGDRDLALMRIAVRHLARIMRAENGASSPEE